MNDAKQSGGYRVVVGDWQTCSEDATLIRHEVFVLEQQVPLEEELDQRDAFCLHALAYGPDGTPVAVGRLLPDGHIGRMAVRKPYRGKGLGALVLARLVEEARKRGYREVELAAQVHAQGFYRAQGFVAEGAVFLDAGIEHIYMRRALAA